MKIIVLMFCILLVAMATVGMVSASGSLVGGLEWGTLAPIDLEKVSLNITISEKNNLIARYMVANYQYWPRDKIISFEGGNLRQFVFLLKNGKLKSARNVSVEKAVPGELASGMYVVKLLMDNMDTAATDKISLFIFYNKDQQPVAVGWGTDVRTVKYFVPGSDSGGDGGSSSSGGGGGGGDDSPSDPGMSW